MDGKDVISSLRSWSKIPIIVVSARGRETGKIAALDLGTDDYINKPFDAPSRQYVALDGDDIVGCVRSVDAAGAAWCAGMFVSPSHRRRGIGKALLCRMLFDDRERGSRCSVLTASHAGALLYPHVGYTRIGTLLMFVPMKAKAA
jgi:CheY-like chemotaxis protein